MFKIVISIIIRRNISYLFVLYMQFIIKIFIFKQSSFYIALDVKNKNCNSLLYSFFFKSTYYSNNFVRYFISVCVDVKKFIATILKTTFAFQISCNLNIDFLRSRQSSLRVELILLLFLHFFSSSRRILNFFNISLRCNIKIDDFVDR